MGQIAGKYDFLSRVNLKDLSTIPTPAAGEHILVSSDNSMNAAGQGNFDCYIVGDGTKAATALELKHINPEVQDIIQIITRDYTTQYTAAYINKTYWLLDGTSASHNVWRGSDYIEIGNAKSVSHGVLATSGQSTKAMTAFFDENKNFISGDNNIGEATIDIPAGAYYVHLQWLSAVGSTVSYSLNYSINIAEDVRYLTNEVEGLVALKEKKIESNFSLATTSNATIQPTTNRAMMAIPLDTAIGMSIELPAGCEGIIYYTNRELKKSIWNYGLLKLITFTGDGTNIIQQSALAGSIELKNIPTECKSIVIWAKYSDNTAIDISQFNANTTIVLKYDTIPAEDVETLSDDGLNILDLGAGYWNNQSGYWMYDYKIAPYTGCEFVFKLPEYLHCQMVGGTSDVTTQIGDFYDGDTYRFRNDNVIALYRFYFYTINNDKGIQTIPFTEMCKNGEIQIKYKKFFDSFLANAMATEKIAFARRKKIKGVNAVDMPIITHISDLHGDAERLENFMYFSESIGSIVAINTGDTVFDKISDGSEFVSIIADKYDEPYVHCIGNHDVFNSNGNENTIFTTLIAPLVNKENYLSANDTLTEKCYYYVDIQNIRVIVMNYYDEDENTGVTTHGNVSLTQSQINWLISTLNSTPANYGIIIARHPIDGMVSKTLEYDNFWTSDNINVGSYEASQCFASGVVNSIIDAYISKSSLTTTAEHYGVTFNINANFSSAAGEFLFYLSGHYHTDAVGYMEGTQNVQLMLNITTGNSVYGTSSTYAGGTIYPRNSRTKSQDAFNAYVIDRDNKIVKIIRIGATLDYNGDEHYYMEIPYA